MASTGLAGPYDLTNAEIDRVLYTNRIGAYALGYSDSNSYYVHYVGRSDENLAGRLKQHVGSYKQFKFGYLDSAKEAFEKECTLYHDFKPVDNKIHPDRPKNTTYRCPVCGA